MDEDARSVGGLAGGLSRVIVALRHLVVLGWIAAAVAAVAYLPGPSDAGELDLPIPDDAAPLEAERRAEEAFGFPLIARTQVIVRDPAGLSLPDQAALGRFALQVSRGEVAGLEGIGAAVPVPNAPGLAPGARESGTAVLTYLLPAGPASIPRQVTLGEEYAEQAPVPEGAQVGLTGSTPARDQQLSTIERRLPLLVVATLGFVVLVVALVLGSAVAPLVVLAVVGVAYTVALRVIGAVAEATGVGAGEDVEPVVTALLIGIVTDYAVFYLFGTRALLRRQPRRRVAAAAASAHYIAIVATAGVTTALGTAALLVGRLDFFRAFAPALALTAVVGMVVAVTLLPALLALLGRAAYWPRGVGAPGKEQPASAARVPERVARAPLGARLLTTRPVAALTALALIAGLGLATWQVRDLRLGLGLTTGVSDAAAQVSAGFAPGYRAPTELLLEGPGATDRAALARLGAALRGREEVVGVIGPGEPAADALRAVFVAPEQGASRFLLVLEEEPTEHEAIARLEALQAALPDALPAAGMPGARAAWAGDTAIAQAAVASIRGELARVGAVALAVNLLLLIVFLGALVAPLYLLLANVLSMGATLGLATLVFQEWLGPGQLVYYVPFAAAVLLLALGSDYNIYLMGQIWRLARGRGVRGGVRAAIPLGSRPITVAGLVLAGTFGLLAIVPVEAMTQFAFVMGVGALVDAFLVRTLLVPALVTVFGGGSFWPGRPPARAPERERAPGDTVGA